MKFLGFGDSLGSLVNHELTVDILDVCAYGIEANHDLACDFLVGQVLRHEAEDI